ncbi:winged helix-turn-helix transcriptional regulator [Nocardioides sp. NBC_00163]|uniref:winged helix-turn-helix transcriptional regulator n=1 Tax=Nocardioides sp. NBC_00163 TaxID=2975999 RepID=UPI003251D75B
MTLNLTYGDLGDACAAAHALDLIGDRWSLIVVRELMFGPRTARDLESSVIGVSTDELKDRLQFLEHAGVVVETELGYITKTTAYALTPWGRELETILGALGRWAHGSTRFPIMSAGMTPSGVMVAMRTMVPAGSATTPEPISVAWELTDARRPDVDPQQFRLVWKGNQFDLAEGTLEDADVTIAGDSTAWTGVVFMGFPVDAAIAEAGLKVEGDRAALDRVLGLFADTLAEAS